MCQVQASSKGAFQSAFGCIAIGGENEGPPEKFAATKPMFGMRYCLIPKKEFFA
jgi:hypothetical protein